MALAKDTPRITAGRRYIAPQVVNASQLFGGSYVALGSQFHATAANQGRAFPWNDANGSIPLGFNQQGVTGDASRDNLAQTNIEGRVIEQLAVTGASAITDVGKWVYMTDDGTFTLTKTTPNIPVGFTTDWYSGTSCDVYMLSLGELLCMQAAGGVHKQLQALIGVGITASGNLATGIVAPCHGQITAVNAHCVIGPTDADVDIDINVEIGGTDITGGVCALLAADVAGDKKAGTAVTADDAEVFHEGDLIDIDGVVNTAGTAADPGLYQVIIDYTIQPGL